MAFHLGIDLGTSNSAVVGNGGGEPRQFKTADGTDLLPSVIHIDRRGHRPFENLVIHIAVVRRCSRALLVGAPVLTGLVESRRLAADLRLQFTRAADLSNRAVMADSDEGARAAARGR